MFKKSELWLFILGENYTESSSDLLLVRLILQWNEENYICDGLISWWKYKMTCESMTEQKNYD